MYKPEKRQAICVTPKYAVLSVSENGSSGLKWTLQGPDTISKWNLDLLKSYPAMRGSTHDTLKVSPIAKTGDEEE